MKRSPFSAKITGRWLRWIYVLCYFKINKSQPTATTNRNAQQAMQIMRHVREQVCVVSVVSHYQSLSYSLASICHACFQSTSITASSPDMYMSMVLNKCIVIFHPPQCRCIIFTRHKFRESSRAPNDIR